MLPDHPDYYPVVPLSGTDHEGLLSGGGPARRPAGDDDDVGDTVLQRDHRQGVHPDQVALSVVPVVHRGGRDQPPVLARKGHRRLQGQQADQPSASQVLQA